MHVKLFFCCKYDTVLNSPKERILFEQKEIKDPNLLLERAKKNINDDKGAKFDFKLDKTSKVLNTYQTTQLVEKKSIGNITESEYVATGIVEYAIASNHSIGDDYMTTHVLVYNTIYYTNSTGTDWNGNVVDCSTFTKGTGQLTVYDGAAYSNAVTFFESGIQLSNGAQIGPKKTVTIGTARTYSSNTNFPALSNNWGYVDAPVYSIKTVIPWNRGGTSGTSTCTFVYIVGDPEGQWF